MSQHQTYGMHQSIPPPPPPPASSYYAGNGNPRKAVDASTDCCAKICGLILLGFAIAGVSLAYIGLLSCRFFEFIVTDSNMTFPPGVESSGGRFLFEFVEEIAPLDTVPSSASKITFWDNNYDTKDRRKNEEVVDTEAPTDAPAPFLGEVNLVPTEMPVLPPSRPTLVPRPTSEEPSYVPTEQSSFVPSAAPSDFERESSVGLFQYLDYEDQVCYYYDIDSKHSLDVFFRVARMGGLLAALASSIATLFLLLEYCFCRVWCSRVFINTGFVLAILGVPTSFLIFSDTRCYPVRSSQFAGVECQLSDGGQAMAIAGLCFLVTLILSCVTPKPVPFVRMAEDMERNGCYDGCCSCWPSYSICGRRQRRNAMKQIAAEDEELERLNAELAPSNEVEAAGGHTYKQYHDENAGFTLQNQYTAAYKRWLVVEADYEEALGRFKRECAEAKVDWRVFMRKAKTTKTKMEQSRELQRVETNDSIERFHDEVSDSLSQFNNDNKKKVNRNEFEDDEDEIFQDDELLRSVDVLTTMRANCDFAKSMMNRIQNDINDYARREDERQALLEQQMREALAAKKKKKEQRNWYGMKDVNDKSESQNVEVDTNSPASVQQPSSSTMEEGRQSTSQSDYQWTTVDQDGDLFASARMNSSNPEVEMVFTRDENGQRDQRNSLASIDENRLSVGTSPAEITEAPTSPNTTDRLLLPIAKAMDRIQKVRPNFKRIKIPKRKKSGNEQTGDEASAKKDEEGR